MGKTIRLGVDPKVLKTEQSGRGKTKITELRLNVFVSDARQERVVSLLAKRFSVELSMPPRADPETKAEVIVALTEFLAQRLMCQHTCTYNV